MFERYLRRFLPAILAAIGSREAQGQLRLFNAQDFLWDEWRVYLGEQRVEQTVDGIRRFMMDRFEVDIGIFGEDWPGRLNREQQWRVFEELARILLANGALSFND